jgi:alkane 1-monooxygenase
MAAFAAATLAPVPLLAFGVAAGGAWLWAALLYMGLLSILLDQILPLVDSSPAESTEFPAADSLLLLLGLIGFALNSLANVLGRRLVPWHQ